MGRETKKEGRKMRCNGIFFLLMIIYVWILRAHFGIYPRVGTVA